MVFAVRVAPSPVTVVGEGVVAGEGEEYAEPRAQGEKDLSSSVHPHLKRVTEQQGHPITT